MLTATCIFQHLQGQWWCHQLCLLVLLRLPHHAAAAGFVLALAADHVFGLQVSTLSNPAAGALIKDLLTTPVTLFMDEKNHSAGGKALTHNRDQNSTLAAC